MSLSGLGSSEVAAVASALNQSADSYGNDSNLEFHWAMKAFHHAETYFNLLIAVDPVILKLTKIDDEIYQKFKEDFKDLKVDVLSEDEIKSEEGKARWRTFCNQFQGRVEDWNMGTLLRLDCTEDITDKNTTLVPRIQFLAIEISRNREGYNSGLRAKFRPNKFKQAPPTQQQEAKT